MTEIAFSNAFYWEVMMSTSYFLQMKKSKQKGDIKIGNPFPLPTFLFHILGSFLQ
jgi:hypothetical protein